VPPERLKQKTGTLLRVLSHHLLAVFNVTGVMMQRLMKRKTIIEGKETVL